MLAIPLMNSATYRLKVRHCLFGGFTKNIQRLDSQYRKRNKCM